MNSREKNLMLLKKAAAGKLTANDLTYNPDEPVFDICLDLKGTGGCKNNMSDKEIQRLKAQGRYFDITLNIA